MSGVVRLLSVAAFSALLSGFAAQAATFDLGTFPIDPNDGKDSISGPGPVDGVTLTILGSLSAVPGAVGSSFDATANRRTVINQNVGAGVCGSNVLGTSGCTGQPLIDSGEMMIFQFSTGVTVDSLSVFNNDQNDLTDFWYGTALNDLKYAYTENLVAPPNRTQPIDNSSGVFSDITFFAVSLRPQQPVLATRTQGNSANERDQFRVTGIDVTPTINVVPLPAAGWMLIAGVGGLGAMSRRRKSKS